MKLRLLCILLVLPALPSLAAEVVNDITQLNPVTVDRVVAPHTLADIVAAVRDAPGSVSIGGALKSQGGQTAEDHSLHLDMRSFNRVIALDTAARRITVEAGITWREIQQAIDPYGLSVSIMQSYANFTVGGALSVNCHGRYVGAGPLVLSVLGIKVVMADGSVVEASPSTRPDVFYGAIGGYGGIGVIAEATLQLATNSRVGRDSVVMPLAQYHAYFDQNIRNSPRAVFHNGVLYGPRYDTVRAVTWSTTDRPVTLTERLFKPDEGHFWDRILIWIVSEFPFGKQFRQYLADPILNWSSPVVWRNHEASRDVAELEPWSRRSSTYVLQEYFVPADYFDAFPPLMAEVLNRHRVNVMNVSIRFARADPGTLLAWARGDTFAFVLYYKQGTTDADKREVTAWTRELVDAAVSVGGTYYLPYQVLATPAQFRRAYPKADAFFALKRRLDPKNRFRNRLWDAYDPALAPAGGRTP